MLPRRPISLLLLIFMAACARGSQSDLLDAAGGAPPMGGKTTRSSQGSGMLCSNSLYPQQKSDAGVDWELVAFRKSEVLILLDGSESTEIASGPDTRARVLSNTLSAIVDGYQDRIAFGLLRFPDATACGADAVPGCCVGAPSVDLGLHQGAAIRAALASQSVTQGSSPMALALQTAANHFLVRPSQGESRLVLLATDGQPGCEGRPGDASISSNACQEAVRMVQIMAKLDPPIRTLVLSPPPSDTSDKADCLRALGEAASAHQARDASIQKSTFTTDEAKALESALEATFLPGQMPKPACNVILDPEPLPNSNFLVTIDGWIIPENDDNGWRITRTRVSANAPIVVNVTLTGEYCTRLQQYRYDKVVVSYDCPYAWLDRPRKGRRSYCRT